MVTASAVTTTSARRRRTTSRTRQLLRHRLRASRERAGSLAIPPHRRRYPHSPQRHARPTRSASIDGATLTTYDAQATGPASDAPPPRGSSRHLTPQHPEPALPARLSDQDATRRASREQFFDLLAALPDKQPTRISVARMVGEYTLRDPADAASFTEYRNLTELGGFVVSGPTSISEITNRFGAGEYRIAAYGLEARGLRWEVFTTLVDTNPKAATHAERS